MPTTRLRSLRAPPTLQPLKRLGGSGHIDEIAEAVVEAEGFTEEQQEVRRGRDAPSAA